MPNVQLDFATRGVALKKQDELAWCYAAVLSIVSHWLTNGGGWDPCQIVAANLEDKLGLTNESNIVKDKACNCCQKKTPSECTGIFAVGKIDDSLRRLNVLFHRGRDSPTSDVVIQEINNNRPILVAFARPGRPGHVAMIVGYDDSPRANDPDRTDMLTLYDPAAVNVPGFSQRADPRTMTFQLTLGELYSQYPTPSFELKYHYIQLALGGGGLAQPPAWAVFH